MKTRILCLSAFLITVSFIVSSYVSGPARHGWDCTGAESDFNNPTGCKGGGCHASAATSGITVAIEIDSAGAAVTNYVGGKSYTVKLTGTNTTNSTLPAFGFQIAATKDTIEVAAPASAGTWGTPPANTHLSAPGSEYVVNIMEHSIAIAPTTGTGTAGSTYVETFNWTAPPAGTGAISFFAALNAVNDNGSADAGDLWNTNHVVIHEEDSTSITGIAAVANNDKLNVYPNPVVNTLNLCWDNAQTGNYTLSVYNISGQVVAYEQMDFNAVVNTKSINTSAWAAGIYLVSLKTDNTTQVFRVVKQ